MERKVLMAPKPKPLPTPRLTPVSRRTVLWGRRPATPPQRPIPLFIGYLLLLLLSEVLTSCTAFPWNSTFYALVLLLLGTHAALASTWTARLLPLFLTLAPVARLLLIFLGPAGPTLLYRILALGIPLLLAVPPTFFPERLPWPGTGR